MSVPFTPGKTYDVFLSDAADAAMAAGVPTRGLIYDAELGDFYIFKQPGDLDEKGVRGDRMVYVKSAFIVGIVEQ